MPHVTNLLVTFCETLLYNELLRYCFTQRVNATHSVTNLLSQNSFRNQICWQPKWFERAWREQLLTSLCLLEPYWEILVMAVHCGALQRPRVSSPQYGSSKQGLLQEIYHMALGSNLFIICIKDLPITCIGRASAVTYSWWHEQLRKTKLPRVWKQIV